MLNADFAESNFAAACRLMAEHAVAADEADGDNPKSVLHLPSMGTNDLMARIQSRLSAAEWSSEAWDGACPACGQTRTVGHRADCWLETSLKELRAGMDSEKMDGATIEPDAAPSGRERRFITTDERLLVVPG
jgi:hypothetical protein